MIKYPKKLPEYFGIKNDGSDEKLQKDAMYYYLVWSGLDINKYPYKKAIFPPMSLFFIGLVLGIILGVSYGR